jgi:hypothetical protein
MGPDDEIVSFVSSWGGVEWNGPDGRKARADCCAPGSFCLWRVGPNSITIGPSRRTFTEAVAIRWVATAATTEGGGER